MDTCPNCGKKLQDITATADTETAPYICNNCARGWWAAELQPIARQMWDAPTRSFRHGDAKEMIHNSVIVERADRRQKAQKAREDAAKKSQGGA